MTSAASFPITYPIVTTAVNYISRFLLTRDRIASEVRGQMKSAVFYFRHDEYMEVRRGNSTPYLNDLVRTQIVDLDQGEALEFAHRNVLPGETVLNSVLLEE